MTGVLCPITCADASVSGQLEGLQTEMMTLKRRQRDPTTLALVEVQADKRRAIAGQRELELQRELVVEVSRMCVPWTACSATIAPHPRNTTYLDCC